MQLTQVQPLLVNDVFSLQDKLLNKSAVFDFDGTYLRFESKTSETYARDVLPGKVSATLSL